MMKQASFEPTSKNSILVEVFFTVHFKAFEQKNLFVEKSNFGGSFFSSKFLPQQKNKGLGFFFSIYWHCYERQDRKSICVQECDKK